MRILFAAALLIIMLCVSSRAHFAQDADTNLINQFISKQAAEEGGEEYEDARKVVQGDLNGDGSPDLAVLYTIEGQNGSNNYVQYLAVFVRTDGRLLAVTHTSVGGKSRRAVELQSITKNVIHLKTMSYAAKDAACCPSKKGAARYALVKGRLKQV
ncbi:MAG TPA: hypothetical protein VKA70_16435 [Blastocatellia bacterium]|nr:hypothetical protein [Blastocatellia bacterium]